MSNRFDELENNDFVNDHTIYVADIPMKRDQYGMWAPAIDENFLKDLFNAYCNVQIYGSATINVKTGKNNQPYAYAYVILKDHDELERAIEELNYTKIDGVPIRLLKNDKETIEKIKDINGKLFIKNLDPDIEVSQLHDAFANFGEIISCKIYGDHCFIPKFGDPNTKEKRYVSRGYGYIHFQNPEDAKQALIDLKDASINGRPVEIQPFCRPQRKRSPAI